MPNKETQTAASMLQVLKLFWKYGIQKFSNNQQWLDTILLHHQRTRTFCMLIYLRYIVNVQEKVYSDVKGFFFQIEH